MRWFFVFLASMSALFILSCDGGKSSTKDDVSVADSDELTTSDDDVIQDYTVTGFVQKGPFVKNSQIDIQELDAALAPTGKSYNTQTEDDLGGFELPSKLSEKYAEIKASGYYFNEITGGVSASTLTFNVLADLSLGEKTNVNILTTLARPRIKYLISDEGKTFSEARVQAEAEVLKAFYIEEDGVSSFQEMDISQQGTSNAILLAISAILQADNTEGQLSQLLGDLMDDLEEDGTIDDAGIKEEIAANAQYVGTMLATIRTNIETYYAELDTTITVPAFEDFCDDDGDTVINKYDFTIVFAPIVDAELLTEYTSNEITIVLPPYAETADATVTGGTLVVNGVDLGETTAELVAGDLIAVKVTTSAELETAVEATVTVVYAGVYTDSLENTGIFTVKTKSILTVQEENGDMVVVDNTIGLMWQRDIDYTMKSHYDAETYCQNLTYAGHDDWRMPTISELRTIIRGDTATVTGGSCGVTDDCLSISCYSNSCNNSERANLGPGENGLFWQIGTWNWKGQDFAYHWSSSIISDDTSNAWCVAFDRGNIDGNSLDRNDLIYVRCVR